MTTVIPDQTRRPSPSTPTTYGRPSARATIAVCEVRPPPSVQNPAASARPSCAASAGDSSCAMAMLPFGRLLGRRGIADADQVAQQALADERDVALAIAEVRILDAIEHGLDLIQRLAHRPLGGRVVVADQPARALDQVDVGQHQAVGLEDAVLLLVALALGDLRLDARQLRVASPASADSKRRSSASTCSAAIRRS